MKHLTVLMILASFFTVGAYAAETTTECPMMMELNERTNPKANLSAKKDKPKSKASGAVRQ